MNSTVLTLTPTFSGRYHAVFTNKNGRKLYIELSVKNDMCRFKECCYIDSGSKKVSEKLLSEPFNVDQLINKIATELDKVFFSVNFSNIEPIYKEDLIDCYLRVEKQKTLILLREGAYLRTIFKNCDSRSIYLEVEIDFEEGRAIIRKCFYCDNTSDEPESPEDLITIFFDYCIFNLLWIVNTQLDGGFTDAVVAEEHTLILNRPICGRI